MTYKKNTLEARIHDLLPEENEHRDYQYTLIFISFQHDGESWSSNDAWRAYKYISREDAIEHLRGRWEVFKENYNKSARVCDVSMPEVNVYEGVTTCDLQCDYLTWAQVEIVSQPHN